MVNEYIIIGYYLMWGLLVFTAVCFLISGLDDLFFDVYYWCSYAWRLWKYRKSPKLTYEKLIAMPEKRIAIMVPCWHEAGIINEMLRYNIYALDYKNYDFFVGVYPNDPETIEDVMSIAKILPHIQCVIGETPGPTNKARNLNSIFNHIMQYEKANNCTYDIFILHDSEDIIHTLSFKIYNYLIPHNQMVQIPIFPLEVSYKYLTHWTYSAEFCEVHTKDIIVRERIAGLVPSAGVGTAFSRAALELLATTHENNLPFGTNTLTEDYSTSLQIRLHGLKEIFVNQFIYRHAKRKRWYFFGPPVSYRAKEYVATRALFPMSYKAAVRQKARWILGIAFQEWINTGWQGNFTTVYTLLHDRKALFTHFITGLFFILIPFWLLYGYYTASLPDYPTLQDRFDQSPWVWWMIGASSILMIGRIIQRMIATYRVYGVVPAILSAPLILYGNIINLHSIIRAYSIFLYTPKTKMGTKWDKTDHKFPAGRTLLTYNLKLGDLLVINRLVSKEQLTKALIEQGRTGEKIGSILLRLKYITEPQLKLFLSKQYSMELIAHDQITPLAFDDIHQISRHSYKQLLNNNCLPIKRENNEITVAIHDPSDEKKLVKIVSWIHPYKAKFVLIS